jgi:hypothetical protein
MRTRSIDQVTVNSGPGNPVTIGGRRGVESSSADGPGGYELYVAHPDGETMYVHLGVEFGSTVPAQQLVDNGRRIAENIRFPGTATVTPSFGLGAVPDGMRVCALSPAACRRPTCTTSPTISSCPADHD